MRSGRWTEQEQLALGETPNVAAPPARLRSAQTLSGLCRHPAPTALGQLSPASLQGTPLLKVSPSSPCCSSWKTSTGSIRLDAGVPRRLLVDQGPTARILALSTFRPDFSPPWTGRAHLTQVTLPSLAAAPGRRADRPGGARQGAARRGGRASGGQDRWGAAVCGGADQDGAGVRPAPGAGRNAMR